ncbi:MAG: NADH-quinone oxidoreductase subunit J [Deltaproteobacteria bacterium]|nr:NADH-quinone oxidoreductase subunit J [Deltaproteobacteria bacterium]
MPPLPEIKSLLFLGLASFTLVSACVVTFSRNIVYSGFSLLGTFAGAAGLFVLLSSDFVAVTQVLIYVGGILVLVLFAIMLTEKVGVIRLTNVSANYKVAVPLVGLFLVMLLSLLKKGEWVLMSQESYQSMVKPIGEALLTKYLLPFEVVSIALLGALVGAVVIVKRAVK